MYSVHQHNFLVFTLLSAGPLKPRGPRPWPSWPCLNPALTYSTVTSRKCEINIIVKQIALIKHSDSSNSVEDFRALFSTVQSNYIALVSKESFKRLLDPIVVRIQKFRIRIQKSRIRIVILVYQNPGSPLKPNRLFPGPCPPLQKFRQKSYTKFLDQDNDPDSGTLDPCRDPGHYKNLIEVGPSATQIPPESFSNQYVLILF